MIVIIMGVSGSGKTTIGQHLAVAMNARFVEGDEFHPPENIDKMSKGTPLTDTDRWPWLKLLSDRLDGSVQRGENIVLSCSLLKQVYRDTLVGNRNNLRLVYLKGSQDLIRSRLGSRKGHFFPSDLLASQFAVLEEPVGAITIDIRNSVSDIVATICRELGVSPRGSHVERSGDTGP